MHHPCKTALQIRRISAMNSCQSETRENENDVESQPTSNSSSGEEQFNKQDYDAYQQTIQDILAKTNVLREFKRNEADLEIIKRVVLDEKRKLPKLELDEFLTRKPMSYSKKLQERREMYLEQTGMTASQHKLATTLLSHLGDHCAKTRNPTPLYVAWDKILEAGMTPMSRVLSTYLYVLGLDEEREESDRDVSAEVAMFHDAIYEPTEKTITLLVKSLVRRGDAAGAEALLDNIPVSFESDVACVFIYG